MEQFKESDLHKGYFCYNCTYFIKPHHCAIVTDEGTDILGRSSGVIAPHGLCSIWIPNEKEIHGYSSSVAASSSTSDESSMNISASFSCETCNRSFNTREELKQHTIDEHKKN